MDSKKAKVNKKHRKELNSLSNKMGSNIIWFSSLPKEKQYDVLFLWKKEKWKEKSGNKSKFIIKDGKKVVNPQLKFKHWIENCKSLHRFSSSKKRIRNSAIDIILTKK